MDLGIGEIIIDVFFGLTSVVFTILMNQSVFLDTCSDSSCCSHTSFQSV